LPKLPQISGRELGKLLVKAGFELVGQKGSHTKFVRLEGKYKRTIIVPDHKILKKGTLASIVKRAYLRLG